MLQLRARTTLQFASGPAPFEVDFEVKTGSLTGLFGPSGSGKTTLLRILAGLTTPEAGFIRVDDQVWFDSGQRINRPTQQRKVGMVFQDAALFPNMNVRQNVAFAAENRRDPVVDELLDLVGLTTLADRKPASLSGGQRQRVALIRALARRPKLLLLDEPFSALDRETRDHLLSELVRLHQRFGTTTVLVSHQQEEIQRVADQMMELNQGRLLRKFERTEPVLDNLKFVSGYVTSIRVESGQSCVQIRLPETSVELKLPLDALKWKVGDALTVPIGPENQIQKPE